MGVFVGWEPPPKYEASRGPVRRGGGPRPRRVGEAHELASHDSYCCFSDLRGRKVPVIDSVVLPEQFLLCFG